MNDRPVNSRRDVLGFGLFALAASASAGPEISMSSSRSWLLIYRPGRNWLSGQPLSKQPLQKHGRYILALYRQRIVRLAGGFSDDSGGAALIESESREQAVAIADADPAVVAGVFVYQLIPWRLVDWDRVS
jgi:uncharacterized protein YciI